MNSTCILPLPAGEEGLPPLFPSPFSVPPHPLAVRAAEDLQQRIREMSGLDHNFGLETDAEGTVYGKMFGVLVVEDAAQNRGYLAAFSGKIGGRNRHSFFVPPVFDILDENGFFRPEEDRLSALNRRIETLENAPELERKRQLLQSETQQAEQAIRAEKLRAKTAQQSRAAQRAQPGLSAEERDALEHSLIHESKRDHFRLKDLKKYWKTRLELLQQEVEEITAEIQKLKEERRTGSAALQQRIFEHFNFLNINGERKNLADIFQETTGIQPPAGAGECAAPKLFQYAFLHGLKPLAAAEFWWGASPVGEIRKHGRFYPACRGKCRPILAHMLSGLPLERDEHLKTPPNLSLATVYEDDHLMVVNKPAGLLSVPGKEAHDSVYRRLKRLYPHFTGPLVVHRLDMATSGLMLIAKRMEIYVQLQSQFIKHTIKKRYVALLDGLLPTTSGRIDLPLRVDLNDRPRQMVCYEYGKAARTLWKTVAIENGRTRVHFFPVTGRTHQLRVHAAHPLGLNTPIVGDDLYGLPSERLYLHAEQIEFLHPVSGTVMKVEEKAGF